MLRKSISLFLSVVMVFIPFIVNAQDTTEIVRQAQKDASRDVKGKACLWMGIGCVGCIFGIGAAIAIQPNPDPARLLGKSPEYVAIYTKAYRQKAQSIQITSALIGCLSFQAFYWYYINYLEGSSKPE